MNLHCSEQFVRQLRAAIYGECTDHNWRECKVFWMRQDSVDWLIDHQPGA